MQQHISTCTGDLQTCQPCSLRIEVTSQTINEEHYSRYQKSGCRFTCTIPAYFYCLQFSIQNDLKNKSWEGTTEKWGIDSFYIDE